MKIIEHLDKATSTLLSFEITPPLRGESRKKTLKTIESLIKYGPSFIHVTSRAANVDYEDQPDGTIKRKIKRKRPGTLGLCTAIQDKYNINSVCHVLCDGFTREETEDLLVDLAYANIHNVFAIRGDSNYQKPISSDRSVNEYALDLVRQIQSMNKGIYLEGILANEPTDFCIGVAAYPEKHPSAPNIKTDIIHLKEKVDAGAKYIITQMFFDNEKYFRFIDLCRTLGIEVPIIPGITPLISKQQVYEIPRKFYVDIPFELSEKLRNANSEDVKKIAIDWTTKQAQELIQQKVPSLHFFVYANVNSTKKVLRNLFG